VLRLTIQTQNPEEITIVVHGRIAGESLPFLIREVERYLGQGPRLVLDLDQVGFIDLEGADLLRGWVAVGLELRSGSLFLRELMSSYGLSYGQS